MTETDAVRRAGIIFHLAYAGVAAFFVVGTLLAAATGPVDICAFPQDAFIGRALGSGPPVSCFGVPSLVLAALASGAGLALAIGFYRSWPPSPLAVVAGNAVAIGAAAVWVVAAAVGGYRTIQTLGFVILGTSVAGVSLVLYPAIIGHPDPTSEDRRIDGGRRPTIRRIGTGLYIVAGGAALVGFLGMWGHVVTSPTGVCTPLLSGTVTAPGILGISAPCYPLFFMLIPAAVGLIAFAAAGALVIRPALAKLLGVAAGVAGLPMGLILSSQDPELTMVSGIVLFVASVAALTLAFHPAMTPHRLVDRSERRGGTNPGT